LLGREGWNEVLIKIVIDPKQPLNPPKYSRGFSFWAGSRFYRPAAGGLSQYTNQPP
jgi:hypothetical protein